MDLFQASAMQSVSEGPGGQKSGSQDSWDLSLDLELRDEDMAVL